MSWNYGLLQDQVEPGQKMKYKTWIFQEIGKFRLQFFAEGLPLNVQTENVEKDSKWALIGENRSFQAVL